MVVGKVIAALPALDLVVVYLTLGLLWSAESIGNLVLCITSVRSRIAVSDRLGYLSSRFSYLLSVECTP